MQLTAGLLFLLAITIGCQEELEQPAFTFDILAEPPLAQGMQGIATGDFYTPALSYPPIQVDAAKYVNVLTFQMSPMMPPLRKSAPTSGPLILFSDDMEVLVFSPMDHFFVSLISYENGVIDYGVAGEVEELPAGFTVHRTKRYVVCYNTSRAYAQWCGSLFERLYMAFTNYWTKKDLELSEPEFPLVAIVFGDKRSYTDFAKREVGDAAGKIVAYFSLQSNRMVMYDLTGVEAHGGMGRDLSLGLRGVARGVSRVRSAQDNPFRVRAHPTASDRAVSDRRCTPGVSVRAPGSRW